MVIKMSEQKLVTLEQLREFLAATEEVGFQGYGQDEERYRHIEAVLMRFGKALSVISPASVKQALLDF